MKLLIARLLLLCFTWQTIAPSVLLAHRLEEGDATSCRVSTQLRHCEELGGDAAISESSQLPHHFVVPHDDSLAIEGILSDANVMSWAKENPYHVLSLAFVTAAMAPTAGPPAMATAAAGRVAVGVLGAERARAIALTGGTQAALKQRHTFFSEEAKKGTRVSANPKPGKLSGDAEKVRVVKPRGMHNPIVREALLGGQKAHNNILGAFHHKKELKWGFNQRVYDEKTNKWVKPDVLTPAGNPIELKPYTPSGIRKGEKQITQYKRATGKNGRVIYYDPKTGKLLS